MVLSFSEEFLKVLEFSRDEAVRTGWHNISPDHIMLAILRHYDNDACRALQHCGVDTALFKESIDSATFVSEPVPWEDRESVHLRESSVSMLQNASLEAARCHASRITPLHFLLAVSRKNGCYSHDWLDSIQLSLRAIVEASGLPWAAYGLVSGADVTESKKAAAPDPQTLAAAIEKRLREGFATGNPHLS